MGHEVCAIEATETEAVNAAARYEPNMMIIDAHLRDGNGMAAVDRITANGYIAHVFVTGDQHSVSNFRPGAVVISKPFTEATLAGAISRARKNT
jgi:FixJ family two-component response regulator